MFYVVKTPWWLRTLYSSFIWKINTSEKILYLTFDDGPHPEATLFVLNELKKFNASATFFCIGKNVEDHPDIYNRILSEGHSIGNHTYSHYNGWWVKNEVYLKDVLKASHFINSSLFRPPYGKITTFQAKQLPPVMKGSKVKVIMWDVVSGDFDEKVSNQQCLENVIFNSKEGSIIVFHDSEKTFSKIQYVLPKVLDFFSKKNYRFEGL